MNMSNDHLNDDESNSSSFLVEEQSSGPRSEAEFSVVDEDEDEKSIHSQHRPRRLGRKASPHSPSNFYAPAKFTNNHSCPFDQDKILQVIESYTE